MTTRQRPTFVTARAFSIFDPTGDLLTRYLHWTGGWMPVIQRFESPAEPVGTQPAASAGVEDDDTEYDGLVRHHNDLYCPSCGMLAQPGDEEFDWCDHITGDDCTYMHEVSDDFD